MSWDATFQIATLTINLSTNTDTCKEELQSIIALYPPASETDHADIQFLFEAQKNKFKLSIDSEILWETTDSRDIPPAFEIHLYQQAIVLLSNNLLSLHASCIETHGAACVFAGVSGAGKSSLCTAALLDGMAYMTDEFTLLDQHGNIFSFPRPLQWDSIDHPAFDPEKLLTSGLFKKACFSFPDPDGKIITSHLWLPERLRHNPIKPRWIILPEYSADAPPAALKQIRRGEALMQLPQHLHHQMSPADNLKELNRRIPNDTLFYTLRFSDVYTAWNTVKKSILN